MGGGEDRTESATPRKRGEARKKGNVPKSSEMSSVGVLLGLLLAARALFGNAGRVARACFVQRFAHLDNTALTISSVMQLGRWVAGALAQALGPILLTAMALGVIINVVQTGPVWSPEALRVDFNRINPLNGLKSFLSTRSLVTLAKSLYKIGLIGLITYFSIRGRMMELMILTRLEPTQALGIVMGIAYQLALRVVTTMLVLAALDFFYQRWVYEKSLRMTKEEVKQEHKQSEGSPMVRSRIRARQRQIAKQRMMSEVPMADVLITNPTHFAVALKYDPERMTAPTVIAKGQDLMAFKIREIAQQYDIPIVENPPLARSLYKLVPLGREIPDSLFEAVAEVLAFVYQINERRRERARADYAMGR